MTTITAIIVTMQIITGADMALVEVAIEDSKLPALFRCFAMLIKGNKMSYKNMFPKGIMWSLAIFFFSNFYLINSALAQQGRYSDWHMGRWMMGGWGMGWFGMIFMIIFWGLVIFGLVSLIRWLIQNTSSKGQTGVRTGSNAMNVLKERYAKGIISRDEFESMKKDILQ
jgi:putative membrane protein